MSLGTDIERDLQNRFHVYLTDNVDKDLVCWTHRLVSIYGFTDVYQGRRLVFNPFAFVYIRENSIAWQFARTIVLPEQGIAVVQHVLLHPNESHFRDVSRALEYIAEHLGARNIFQNK